MLKKHNTIDWIVVASVLAVVVAIGYFVWKFNAYVQSNHEWSELQIVRASHADQPISDLEFVTRNERHLLCVRGIAGTRIWILLDTKYDGYKQLPPDAQFDLKDQDYSRIMSSAPVTPVVSRCLRSHILSGPR